MSKGMVRVGQRLFTDTGVSGTITRVFARDGDEVMECPFEDAHSAVIELDETLPEGKWWTFVFGEHHMIASSGMIN